MPSKKAEKWSDRNFITEVLLPSFLMRKTGQTQRPIFPKLTGNQVCITWIGHASFLVQTPKHNILIDPNWSNWLLVVRRLRKAGFPMEDLPNIDVVLITHAHFDHLNRGTLKKIAARQPVIVPVGVKDLVSDLGFEQVVEMNWWEEFKFKDLEVVFTPAKHWGARTITDRHRGYGGYLMRYQGRSIYHAGDSAYFKGFKEIGQRLAPEIALLPIGAYEPPSFRDVHISPEDAVKAFAELQAKVMIPMHFGTYRMSYEPLHEPAQRLLIAGSGAGMLNQIRFLVEGIPQVF